MFTTFALESCIDCPVPSVAFSPLGAYWESRTNEKTHSKKKAQGNAQHPSLPHHYPNWK